MRNLMFLAIFVPLFSAHARNTNGFDRGNGGDVVICKEDTGAQSITLLDWYEMQEVRKAQIWPYLELDRTADEFVDLLIQRVHARYPKYGYILNRLYLSFDKVTSFAPDSRVPEINDQGTTYLPNNCTLRQVAINVSDSFNGISYLINKDLYSQLPEAQKATLILHELVYRASIILNPHQPIYTSENIRSVVAAIASTNFDDPIFKTYLDKHFDLDLIAKQNKK